MTKYEILWEQLHQTNDWHSFLKDHSALPGPRANLELVAVTAEAGDRAFFDSCMAVDSPPVSANTPAEFLVVCGLVGLGSELARGERDVLEVLRRYADDPRWRLRESVAMALQRWGDVDLPALLAEMTAWVDEGPLRARAAVAALCEPRLLQDRDHAAAVLKLLDRAMGVLKNTPAADRLGRDVLKKGLGYGWSVAVAALPDAGKSRLAYWASSEDKLMRWVVRSNLQKARLQRLDPAWVDDLLKLSGG